jgi:hypothetical protein
MSEATTAVASPFKGHVFIWFISIQPVLAAPKQCLPICHAWKVDKVSQSKGTIVDSTTSVGSSWKYVSVWQFVLNYDPTKHAKEVLGYCELWKPNTSQLNDGHLSIEAVPITWSFFEVNDIGDIVCDRATVVPLWMKMRLLFFLSSILRGIIRQTLPGAS